MTAMYAPPRWPTDRVLVRVDAEAAALYYEAGYDYA